MFERWLVPTLSTVLSFLLLLAGFASLLLILLAVGYRCNHDRLLYTITVLALPPACLIGSAWLFRLMFRPRSKSFLIAVAIPAVAIAAFAVAAQRDAAAERQCRAHPPTEPAVPASG